MCVNQLVNIISYIYELVRLEIILHNNFIFIK